MEAEGGDAEAPAVLATTAYVSMLPYAYTTSDVAQLFAPFGRLARVLVLRDRETRRSRGVAFVQFARAEDCARAVAAMHGAQLEGLTLAVSLSRDNGRAREFAKRRAFLQTLRCFECGAHGHYSYDCPRNVLGHRERPVTARKLKKKRKRFDPHERVHYFNDEGTTDLLAPPKDSEQDLSLSLLAYPSKGVSDGDVLVPPNSTATRRIRKPSSYFSDEDPSDEDDN